ncbi:hypothetical protein FCM35_KLT06228 [Carex littledalei]|uniref:Uncharacterized protein n=1 Tax=Carex littledalei TaxID=544730 RepID=A0A833QLU0_9POAL|nr:hypothetical protein FCM35_KLT06228 [Carex littledalei]
MNTSSSSFSNVFHNKIYQVSERQLERESRAAESTSSPRRGSVESKAAADERGKRVSAATTVGAGSRRRVVARWEGEWRSSRGEEWGFGEDSELC